MTSGKYLKYISFSIKNIYLFSKTKNQFQLKRVFQMTGDLDKRWQVEKRSFFATTERTSLPGMFAQTNEQL